MTAWTGSYGLKEAEARKKEYAYDAVGNVTAITDALGNTTHYEYSPAGELTKVTDALGNETEYRYDPCGRLAEIRQYGEEGSLKDGLELSGMDGELELRGSGMTPWEEPKQ